MNTKQEPLLTKSVEIMIPDEDGRRTVKAELQIDSYMNPIFKFGDIVHTMAQITRLDNKNNWGFAFYADIMEETEMEDKLKELSEHPETIKHSFSK